MEPTDTPLDAAARLMEGTANAETMAGGLVCADAETMVGHPIPTDATPLAWSVPGEIVDYPDTGSFPVAEPQHGRFESIPLQLAAAAAAVALGAVAVAVLLHSNRQPPDWPVPAPTTVTVAAPPVATVVMPTTHPPAGKHPTREATPSKDQQYLTLVTQLSTLVVTDPTPVIAMGHAQCAYLGEPGATLRSTANALVHQYSGAYDDGSHLTFPMAYGIVQAAVAVYCPQYKE